MRRPRLDGIAGWGRPLFARGATGDRFAARYCAAMSQENVEVVRQAIDAFNRRDLEAWEALSLPDAEVDWSASNGLEAGVYRGREEVERFTRTFETFESVTTEPERLIQAGASVVVPNTARFRGREGIETVARSTFVYELRDGLIARLCLYHDTAEALEAIGLSD